MTRSYKRRWSDNDRNFGPFTYSRSKSYRPLAMVISSGCSDEDDGGCHIRISAFGHTLLCELPAVIKPHQEKIQARWGAETIARLGRDWYIAEDSRDYGFSLSDGFLQVFHGRMTHDSSTDKTKGYFIPWKQWRHIRYSLYDLTGQHFWTEPKRGSDLGAHWDARHRAVESCPTMAFAFIDFDGEPLTAKTHIEEREWKFGQGRFAWLSLFRSSKVVRSLAINFSGETGRRKGSWKGGTIGSSINMLPGEIHEAAFKRYCAKHEMTFVRAVPSPTREG